MTQRLPEYGGVSGFENPHLTELHAESDTMHPTLRELAEHFSKDGRRVFDRFMWDFVGHPDPRMRLAGYQPELIRRRSKPDAARIYEASDKYRVLEFSHELFTGYSPIGSLVHVRAVPGFNDDPDGYLVAFSNATREIEETKVLRAKVTGDFHSREVVLEMMSGKRDARSWPPTMRPHRSDLWKLRITHGGDVQPTVILDMDRVRNNELFRPIEELNAAIRQVESEPLRTLGHLSLVYSVE